MNPLAPVIAIALPVALVIAEHYAPWQRWIGRPLPQFAAYVLGSLSVFIPASIAAVFVATTPAARETVMYVLALFWGALVCAGLVVGIMRWIDYQNEKMNRLHDQMDRQYYGNGK